MKTKAQSIKILNEDRLADVLSEVIEQKHWDLLRVVNSRLVTLFWEIGKELNGYFDKGKTKKTTFFIRAISTQMVANFGPYFFQKNLKKMRYFNDQFPDFSIVVQIATYISWEHILLLLQIKDWEAKLFYIRITIEQGLTVNSLRKQISANLYEQRKVFKSKKGNGTTIKNSVPGKVNIQKPLQLFQLKLRFTQKSNLAIKNVFKEPALFSFRPLLVASNGHRMLIGKYKDRRPDIDKELFSVLSGTIVESTNFLNRWINGNLNLYIWEIGQRINHEVLLQKKGTSYRKLIIRNISVKLRKNYGGYFSEKHLYEMSIFAEQFPDKNIALRIAYLINWEHILELLPLREIEAKLFYARLVATQRLSVAGLRKQIAENAYAQKSEAKAIERNTITALKNPVIRKSIKKIRSGVIETTTTFIDLQDANRNATVINIFKNPCLPLLTW